MLALIGGSRHSFWKHPVQDRKGRSTEKREEKCMTWSSLTPDASRHSFFCPSCRVFLCGLALLCQSFPVVRGKAWELWAYFILFRWKVLLRLFTKPLIPVSLIWHWAFFLISLWAHKPLDYTSNMARVPIHHGLCSHHCWLGNLPGKYFSYVFWLSAQIPFYVKTTSRILQATASLATALSVPITLPYLHLSPPSPLSMHPCLCVVCLLC